MEMSSKSLRATNPTFWRKLQNEHAKSRRMLRKLKGICQWGGCKEKTKYTYCKAHAIENVRLKRERRQLLAKRNLEYEEAFKILGSFWGSTLIERARAAREYYFSVESALV